MKHAPYVDNPPWVGHVLADTLKTLDATVPADWLPTMDSIRRGKRGSVVGTFKEYGCGVYGCVIPTHDPGVVLKLTTDDTEAQFAADLANTLVAPICVHYHTVLETKIKHQGRRVYLLWRDSAEDVGKIRNIHGRWAVHYINSQHSAAQAAYRQVQKDPLAAEHALAAWRESCEVMSQQREVPDLRALGAGLVKVWDEQGILFGDIHEGNLGRVAGQWVITDPGNIAVVENTTAQDVSLVEMRSNPGGRDVAAIVSTAARRVATGPGRTHALISDVWAQVVRDGEDRGVSYDEFRCELIRLSHDGRIHLVRGLEMKSKAAKSSELVIGRDTFHAIQVEAQPHAVTPPARSALPGGSGLTEAVRKAVHDMPPDGRYGNRKVFISEVWSVISQDRRVSPVSLPAFKRWLLDANRNGVIELARADLVGAMNRHQVEASETEDRGATFHFIIDPQHDW